MSADSSRLPSGLDLGDINDGRALAIGRVPANSWVLDIGLTDVSVAQALTEMGCRVWGVALERDKGEMARGVCEKVFEADLNALDIIELVGDQRFDIILMLDVLDELVNPTALLSVLPGVLADDGWGVISLPNVAHASLRLDFLQGRFGFSDRGPAGRTQLHFFDRHGIEDLLQEAGWQMFDLARVLRPLDDFGFQSEGVDAELVGRLESDIEALTQAFVLGVAPLGSSALKNHPVLPGAAAQATLFLAMNRIAELEEEVRQLNKHHLPNLLDQLDEIREKSLERKGKLKDILAAMREFSAMRES